MDAELEHDKRDVADLWNEALRSYHGIVGVELRPNEAFSSVEAMVAFGTEQMEGFHRFRHDQKKVDRLRSLLKENLEYIELGAQQLVAAATPAFPPSAAIGAAFTYLLSACKQVSADYDVVTAFFEDMNSFLQRITILESRLPKYAAYRNCLMDVFASLLEMCGYATKYAELGRFRKWILNMVLGEDGDLGDARKKMDVSLARLQAATEYAILGNTEELQRMNNDLRENQKAQAASIESQTRMLEDVLERQDGVRDDLVRIRKLLVVFDEQRQTEGKPPPTKKSPTSSSVRNFFRDTIDPVHVYRQVKDQLIPETCDWLFEEPAWGAWAGEKREENEDRGPKILVISGSPGAGKSHLAAAAYDRLTELAKQGDGTNCVALFFFREGVQGLDQFYFAINWAVIQVAEQSATLCDQIIGELNKDDSEMDLGEWGDVLANLLRPCFSGDGSTAPRLQIILDGLDELEDAVGGDEVVEFLRTIEQTTSLRISVLCTTRTANLRQLDGLQVATVAVSKEKQMADLKTLVWSRLNHDVGLRKLNRYIKQRIASQLEEKSDGLLYAENMLRWFGGIRREPVILKKLNESMPGNLQELYREMLADLERLTAAEHHGALRTLLVWLAFAERPLTLAECLFLLEMSGGDAFDLGEEMQTRHLSAFLKMADAEERAIDDVSDDENDDEGLQPAVVAAADEDDDPDSEYDDANIPIKFQERPMRQFFRSAASSTGGEGLRTPAVLAHVRILDTCARILSGGAGENVPIGLLRYAATSWAFHLSWARLASVERHLQDSEKRVCLEALGAILTNQGNVAATVESLGMDHEPMLRRFPSASVVLAHIGMAAKEAATMATTAPIANSAWVERVLVDQKNAFLPLTEAHVTNWFRAVDLPSALRAYDAVRSLAEIAGLDHIVDDQDEEDEAESAILGFADVFKVEKGANGHWAVGAVLAKFDHYAAAIAQFQKALAMDPGPVERLRILNSLASAQLEEDGEGENSDEEGEEEEEQEEEEKEEEEKEEGVDKTGRSIDECLSHREGIPPSLVRAALATRGRILSRRGDLDDAIAAFDEARHADPSEPMRGDVLQDLFEVYVDKQADAELMDAVKGWTASERLAWMTWAFDTARHEQLRRAAARAGEGDFLLAMYGEVIALLDRVDAAPPVSLELAMAHWRVGGDVAAARQVIDGVLGSSSDGTRYRFTNGDPQSTATEAVVRATALILEQFRAAADAETKAKLLAEARQLTETPLVRSVSCLPLLLAQHHLLVAPMVRKMGPAVEFEALTRRAADVCFKSLTDGVGWNDAAGLAFLGMAVMSVGLEREAKILMSAVFYELGEGRGKGGEKEREEKGGEEKEKGENEGKEEGKEEEGEKEGKEKGKEEGNEDEEEGKEEEEGQDLEDIDITCDGSCHPTKTWSSFADGPMFQCLACLDTSLCTPCYEQTQRYFAGTEAVSASPYCDASHRFIRLPVDGWRGIKGGILRIDGEPPVRFADWLADLRDNKWDEAWRRFWLE